VLYKTGCGQGRGSNNHGGRFDQAGGRSYSGHGCSRGLGTQVRRRINLDARSVRSQTMNPWIVDRDLMNNIKWKKYMQQLLHLLMVWTQTGMQIQGEKLSGQFLGLIVMSH
jgi:hypothetical protein